MQSDAEKAWKKDAEGEAGLIMTMYKNGLLPEQIASATDKTVEEIKTIIQGKGIFDEI